jgi:maleylacetate reductase
MYRATLAMGPLERVYSGVAATEAILAETKRLSATRVFLICSNTLRHRTDEVATIERALGSTLVGVFDSIRPHAPREDIVAAARAANKAAPDMLVSIGGGSVSDATKIIALCLKHGLFTADAMEPFHIRVNEDHSVTAPTFAGPDIPVVLIPTTLSGGEFNAMSGCKDERVNVKQAYTHPRMLPRAVILDPAVTVHTPEWIWLSTGVRALDHCFETLGSLASNDYWDGVAINGIRLLISGLPAVKRDPTDLDARQQCQMGAMCSVVAMVAGLPLGLSHATGHALGGAFDVPHGYTSCVMAPVALEYNRSVNAHRQELISWAFGEPTVPAHELADRIISDLGMPRSLREVNVGEENLTALAGYIYQDIWCGTNPRPVESSAALVEFLRLAL